MNTKNTIKVLIVDDESSVRDFLLRFLKLLPVEAKAASDGMQAIELAKQEGFDLVFMDIRMPEMNGLQAFSELKKINPDLTCVFMTGYSSEAALLNNTKQICLRKPFDDINQIRDIVNKMMQNVQASSEREQAAQDRREYIRLDTVLEVDYKLRQSQQEQFMSSLSKDISPAGIGLFIQEALPLGTILDMVIRVAGFTENCRAVGEIVWIKRAEDKGGYYIAGIKFTEIDVSKLANLLINGGKIT